MNRAWNGGDCCGMPARQHVDDVGFLAALIDDLARRYPIDRQRVYMTGHSNGGIMAFRFACDRPDLIAAVVPVSAALETTQCTPTKAVPLLDIHGDSDRNVPLDGGHGARSVAGVDFRSTADSMARWSAATGCASNPDMVQAPPLSTTTWRSCRDGVTTQLIVVAGADHPWPGSTDRLAPRLQGDATRALDATAAAWRFFVEHGRK
jgi:polyhydroxybutyrate depolymerase